MDVNKMVQNETLMRRVLEYHISPGILGPEDLVSTDDVPTLLGKDIQLTTRQVSAGV